MALFAHKDSMSRMAENEQKKIRPSNKGKVHAVFVQMYDRIHRIMSSFTLQIGIVICIQTIILALVIIFSFYFEARDILLRDLNTHLRNLANLSVLTFSEKDIKKIIVLRRIINENNQTILNNIKNKFLNSEYKKK